VCEALALLVLPHWPHIKKDDIGTLLSPSAVGTVELILTDDDVMNRVLTNTKIVDMIGKAWLDKSLYVRTAATELLTAIILGGDDMHVALRHAAIDRILPNASSAAASSSSCPYSSSMRPFDGSSIQCNVSHSHMAGTLELLSMLANAENPTALAFARRFHLVEWCVSLLGNHTIERELQHSAIEALALLLPKGILRRFDADSGIFHVYDIDAVLLKHLVNHAHHLLSVFMTTPPPPPPPLTPPIPTSSLPFLPFHPQALSTTPTPLLSSSLSSMSSSSLSSTPFQWPPSTIDPMSTFRSLATLSSLPSLPSASSLLSSSSNVHSPSATSSSTTTTTSPSSSLSSTHPPPPIRTMLSCEIALRYAAIMASIPDSYRSAISQISSVFPIFYALTNLLQSHVIPSSSSSSTIPSSSLDIRCPSPSLEMHLQSLSLLPSALPVSAQSSLYSSTTGTPSSHYSLVSSLLSALQQWVISPMNISIIRQSSLMPTLLRYLFPSLFHDAVNSSPLFPSFVSSSSNTSQPPLLGEEKCLSIALDVARSIGVEEWLRLDHSATSSAFQSFMQSVAASYNPRTAANQTVTASFTSFGSSSSSSASPSLGRVIRSQTVPPSSPSGRRSAIVDDGGLFGASSPRDVISPLSRTERAATTTSNTSTSGALSPSNSNGNNDESSSSLARLCSSVSRSLSVSPRAPLSLSMFMGLIQWLVLPSSASSTSSSSMASHSSATSSADHSPSLTASSSFSSSSSAAVVWSPITSPPRSPISPVATGSSTIIGGTSSPLPVLTTSHGSSVDSSSMARRVMVLLSEWLTVSDVQRMFFIEYPDLLGVRLRDSLHNILLLSDDEWNTKDTALSLLTSFVKSRHPPAPLAWQFAVRSSLPGLAIRSLDSQDAHVRQSALKCIQAIGLNEAMEGWKMIASLDGRSSTPSPPPYMVTSMMINGNGRSRSSAIATNNSTLLMGNTNNNGSATPHGNGDLSPQWSLDDSLKKKRKESGSDGHYEHMPTDDNNTPTNGDAPLLSSTGRPISERQTWERKRGGPKATERLLIHRERGLKVTRYHVPTPPLMAQAAADAIATRIGQVIEKEKEIRSKRRRKANVVLDGNGGFDVARLSVSSSDGDDDTNVPSRSRATSILSNNGTPSTPSNTTATTNDGTSNEAEPIDEREDENHLPVHARSFGYSNGGSNSNDSKRSPIHPSNSTSVNNLGMLSPSHRHQGSNGSSGSGSSVPEDYPIVMAALRQANEPSDEKPVLGNGLIWRILSLCNDHEPSVKM
jgi:hypothetical protein